MRYLTNTQVNKKIPFYIKNGLEWLRKQKEMSKRAWLMNETPNPHEMLPKPHGTAKKSVVKEYMVKPAKGLPVRY